MTDSLYTATIRIPAGLNDDQASLFAALPGEDAISSSLVRENPASEGEHVETGWTVEWLFPGAPDGPALAAFLAAAAAECGLPPLRIAAADFTFRTIDPDTNWLEQSYRAFPAFTVGGFYIHGSHATEPAPDGYRPLQIDAATAFGSGEHGTTAGCLLLLESLKRKGLVPRHILDMGCGSGILGIAAWMLFGRPVVASDIDPESARVTAAHAAINHVPVWDESHTTTGLIADSGDGFAVGVVQRHAPYDLVIANILPAPLLAMADDMIAACAPGAFIILSGILNEKAEDVRAAYLARGLSPVEDVVQGDWTSILMQVPHQ